MQSLKQKVAATQMQPKLGIQQVNIKLCILNGNTVARPDERYIIFVLSKICSEIMTSIAMLSVVRGSSFIAK